MPRIISIADERKRDAQIESHGPARREPMRWISKTDHASLKLERLVKSTEKTSLDALTRSLGGSDAIAKALVEGDPEIDLEQVGRRLGQAARVWVGQAGQILYAARVLSVVTGPDGVEKSRTDFVDVEATVGEDQPPLVWSGRLVSAAEVVRKYAFTRKQQLRHVNGLTFDFLFDMAKTLETSGQMLRVGTGARGQQPLVFQTNGTRFQGFLEGRTRGESYLLVLHLSNLEIKPVSAAKAAP